MHANICYENRNTLMSGTYKEREEHRALLPDSCPPPPPPPPPCSEDLLFPCMWLFIDKLLLDEAISPKSHPIYYIPQCI